MGVMTTERFTSEALQALIDLLVEKGVITAAEKKQINEDIIARFTAEQKS